LYQVAEDCLGAVQFLAEVVEDFQAVGVVV
jgi:hypothetical protein